MKEGLLITCTDYDVPALSTDISSHWYFLDQARLKDKARNRSPQDMIPVDPIQLPPPPTRPTPPTPIMPFAVGDIAA